MFFVFRMALCLFAALNGNEPKRFSDFLHLQTALRGCDFLMLANCSCASFSAGVSNEYSGVKFSNFDNVAGQQ